MIANSFSLLTLEHRGASIHSTNVLESDVCKAELLWSLPSPYAILFGTYSIPHTDVLATDGWSVKGGRIIARCNLLGVRYRPLSYMVWTANTKLEWCCIIRFGRERVN